MNPGYDHPLYLLPFDHRPPYAAEVFRFRVPAGPQQAADALAAKQIIYDAFRAAIAGGVAPGDAGILVDALFAAPILRDAVQRGLITVMPVEESGATEFAFERGYAFAQEIDAFRPTFVKALVRYNPEGDAVMNVRQLERLRTLSEHCRSTGRLFMLELIVAAEPQQMEQARGDAAAFDLDIRPGLMARAIREIQDAGIETDVWKVEGLDRRTDCIRIAEAARSGGRSRVGLVVLGRGEDEGKVRHWLEMAAGVPGFIGFAVGRTTFSEPILEWRATQCSRDEAVAEIARRYRVWVDVFQNARAMPARAD